MIKTNFIYFPSFSAGEMGSNFVKDHRFRNDMTIRFYSEEYPEEFQHNQLLITAGAHMSVQDYKNKMGLTDRNLVMGDSDLDITKLVIEKLNTALPSIKIN